MRNWRKSKQLRLKEYNFSFFFNLNKINNGNFYYKGDAPANSK